MCVEKETIKCAGCNWNSQIGRINWLVIYYDIICPKCGSIVIKGHYPSKPSDYKKQKDIPWKKYKFDEDVDKYRIYPSDRYSKRLGAI